MKSDYPFPDKCEKCIHNDVCYRGKVSVNECSRCGRRPVISENHLGLFTIKCPRCLIGWDHPEESIEVGSLNLYEAIKEWNRMNQKKEGDRNDCPETQNM